jgi:hypothetical protein
MHPLSFTPFHQSDSHKMTMKAAITKNTFFFVSFKTDKEFTEPNRSLIEIVKMLRSRPDKVPHDLNMFVLGEFFHVE